MNMARLDDAGDKKPEARLRTETTVYEQASSLEVQNTVMDDRKRADPQRVKRDEHVQKNKKNHYKHAGESKHISSFEEVMARNRADAPRPERQAKKRSSEDELPEAPEPVKPSRKGIIETVNPNLQPRNEMKDGVELSRKQREELEKERARRHFEELHRQGKTPEAKADLARHEEVKKRREEAALKRKEDEEKAAAAEVSKAKGNTKSEFSEALGGDAVRMRGERSQAKKKESAELIKAVQRE